MKAPGGSGDTGPTRLATGAWTGACAKPWKSSARVYGDVTIEEEDTTAVIGGDIGTIWRDMASCEVTPGGPLRSFARPSSGITSGMTDGTAKMIIEEKTTIVTEKTVITRLTGSSSTGSMAASPPATLATRAKTTADARTITAMEKMMAVSSTVTTTRTTIIADPVTLAALTTVRTMDAIMARMGAEKMVTATAAGLNMNGNGIQIVATRMTIERMATVTTIGTMERTIAAIMIGIIEKMVTVTMILTIERMITVIAIGIIERTTRTIATVSSTIMGMTNTRSFAAARVDGAGLPNGSSFTTETVFCRKEEVFGFEVEKG